ncbi:MAG: DUF4870 domain-containing protein [Kiritimatiellales bacterium]|nr:DUF4870 domain-containing protein [Kiritimatiellota bacterium]MBL7012313.1 DUF4870 domain-containing protein [Kiritimatiellales bacterium]
MSLADDIQKLSDLKQSGALSEQEYEQAKQSLLAQHRPAEPLMVLDANTWGALIHLSQFCTYLLPLAGIIVPFILWQIKKDESAIIDRHGKIVMNWLFTEFILLIIAGILCFALIGFPLILLISIAGIIFPVIGAIKAGNGEIWPYPCSIRFFK